MTNYTIRTADLPTSFYDERTTLGGGSVRDVIPFEGAVRYVTDDGIRYGVEYECGTIDWIGDIEQEA